MSLAIVAIVLVVGLASDVLLGITVIVPFLLCVWWVQNHYLTVLRDAVQSNTRKHKLSIVQDKES
jgi:hypothetical protein